LLTALAASIILLLSRQALADPADTIGLTWAGRGGAGTLTASASGAAAAYYNPAGLALSGNPGFFVGALYVYSGLNPEKARASEGAFIEAGLHMPIVRAGKFPDIWFGLCAMTPPTSLYSLNLYDDEEPVFVLLSSRERRLSLSAALALELFDIISLGVGFELMPTVEGRVDLDLANKQGHNSLHVDVGYRLSPTAGITVKPHDSVRIGISYRGENRADVDIPVDVKAEGIELSARVLAQTFYVPHKLSGGVEWAFAEEFAAAADLSWYMFSRFVHPSPEVALYDSQGNDTLGATVSAPAFSDVVSPALALKYRGVFDAAIGYRYMPAAIDEQPGRTNLLDNDRHLFTLGARVNFSFEDSNPVSLAITADFFVAYFPSRIHYKEELLPDNAGYPSLEFGGYRLGGGLGVELGY